MSIRDFIVLAGVSIASMSMLRYLGILSSDKRINLRDGLVMMGTWFLIIFGLQYFNIIEFAKASDGTQVEVVQEGKEFVAPKSGELIAKPLNIEVDFVDQDLGIKGQQAVVETELARMVFSTAGATIEEYGIKRIVDGKLLDIFTTIEPTENKEEQCFLVALDKQTPYKYELIKQEDTSSAIYLTYRAQAKHVGTIEKKFTISKETYEIDLDLTITPESGKHVQPRIFFPAPDMLETRRRDIISGIYTNQKNSIVKISCSSINPDKGWFQPTLFGADSRYTIQTMIKDAQHFTQRGYFRLTDQKNISVILEGPTIQEVKTWHISFYFGPKEEKAIAEVDPRLEQTLEYSGLLAPIAKVLLKILKFFYRYLGNYGLAIIAVTLLIRLLLIPFAANSEKQARKSKELKKKLSYVEQKYKNDPERLAREKAEIIRKYGLPGLGGCLPMLLQIPVFFALSRVLGSSIELYKAPFLWMPDLSAPDPYYILPGLLTFGMLAQAATMPGEQRVMFIIIGIGFGAFSASFSAGLTLYIAVSTLLMVLQSVIQKQITKWRSQPAHVKVHYK